MDILENADTCIMCCLHSVFSVQLTIEINDQHPGNMPVVTVLRGTTLSV